MSVVLLLVTWAVFLLVTLLVDFRHHRAADAARRAVCFVARASSAQLPADLLFHAGHTWVRVHRDNLVSIGATDFASNFAGELATIALPREFRLLHQGEPAWTLVSAKGRRLEQVMPIDGKVLAVNRELIREPNLVQRHPYDSGWILRVRPRDIHRSVLQLLSVAADRLWIEGISARVTALAGPSIGKLLDDANWATAFGDSLNDVDWDTLRHELFPTDAVLGKAC